MVTFREAGEPEDEAPQEVIQLCRCWAETRPTVFVAVASP